MIDDAIIPVPAADGIGASVDVTTHGPIKSIVASGDFGDRGVVTIEHSPDGITWASVAANDGVPVTFDKAGALITVLVCGFLRARVSGSPLRPMNVVCAVASGIPFTPRPFALVYGDPVSIGIENDPGVDDRVSRSDHVHQGQCLQRHFDEVGNVTTTDTSDPPTVDLVSRSLTVEAGSFIEVYISTTFQNSIAGNNVRFTVKVAGTLVGGMLERIPVNAGKSTSAFVFRTGALTAGAKIVLVEWSTGGNTARINGATDDYEHFHMTTSEWRL
jgi:hypothetical protein